MQILLPWQKHFNRKGFFKNRPKCQLSFHDSSTRKDKIIYYTLQTTLNKHIFVSFIPLNLDLCLAIRFLAIRSFGWQDVFKTSVVHTIFSWTDTDNKQNNFTIILKMSFVHYELNVSKKSFVRYEFLKHVFCNIMDVSKMAFVRY